MPDASNLPKYELRAFNRGADQLELVIWQMPCAATPHVKRPVRVAGLKGRNLSFVENSILKSLKRAGIDVCPAPKEKQTFSITEDLALNLGLLFRVLAPMRSADRIRLLSSEIGQMEKEEIAYWLGMAMHRRDPRKVLSALRILLTAPQI